MINVDNVLGKKRKKDRGWKNKPEKKKSYYINKHSKNRN